MRVDPTYQRLEDLEGILHDNLRASSWADQTNPIYDRVAASEVQNFIEDSEVTYESLSTLETEAKTEATSTAMGDKNVETKDKKVDIYGDMDEDVFKKKDTGPPKNQSSKTVGFGETEIYQDPSTQFEGPKDDMGGDIYQDPSEAIPDKKKDFTSSPSSNTGTMDDMGEDIYQDPSTSVETKKPDDPFGNNVYQDPTDVQSTKKPDDEFGDNSIYQDPTLIEKPNTPEDDPYEDLSTIQTAVKESKSKKMEPKGDYPSETLRSSSSISSVVSKQGTLTRQMSPSLGKRPYKPGQSRLRMQGSTSDETPLPPETRRQAPRLHNQMKVCNF